MNRTAHSIARTGMSRAHDQHLEAANDPKVLRKVEPSEPLVGRDSKFVYVKHESTDIRKTFERARLQMVDSRG